MTTSTQNQQRTIEYLLEEVNRLKEELELYKPQHKLSDCCKELLMPFISDNEKMCTGCGKRIEWSLDEGQEPLFTDSHDNSDFLNTEK